MFMNKIIPNEINQKVIALGTNFRNNNYVYRNICKKIAITKSIRNRLYSSCYILIDKENRCKMKVGFNLNKSTNYWAQPTPLLSKARPNSLRVEFYLFIYLIEYNNSE